MPDKRTTDGEDESDVLWSAGLAREWADDLSEPRQDIYSLTDGVQVDAAR